VTPRQNQRLRQYHKPPHILLTTPESLCLLLSQEKWLAPLSHARWLIVDEIHALAENKRGAHLAISMERLAALTSGRDGTPSVCHARVMKALRPNSMRAFGRTECRPYLQRIGLSATVSPLAEVAQFLVGTHGRCEIIDASSAKKIELRVHTPLRKDPYPEAGFTGERLVRELGTLIRKHRTTLVFCNTRSGAEATTFWLRENFPDLANVDRMSSRLARARSAARCRGPFEARRIASGNLLDEPRTRHRHRLRGTRRDDGNAQRREQSSATRGPCRP
jgi:ATP-dependent Lhr-like helicase